MGAAGEPRVSEPGSEQTDVLLQQLVRLLQEREIESLVRGLMLVMRAGGGWGTIEIEIHDGRVHLVRPAVSIKPGRE